MLFRSADLPSLKGGRAQMAVQNPKRDRRIAKWPANVVGQRKMMLGDQGGSVGSVLIVEGHRMNGTWTKGVDGGAHRRADVQPNVMIPNAAKQLGGVHGGTVFIVAADGEGVGGVPAVGLRA